MTDMGGEEIRIQLARMEGKQDVTNERLNNVATDVAGLRSRVHDQGNAITKIIAERTVMIGEYRDFTKDTTRRVSDLEEWKSTTKGVALGGKHIWAGIIGVPTALVALLKLLGI